MIRRSCTLAVASTCKYQRIAASLDRGTTMQVCLINASNTVSCTVRNFALIHFRLPLSVTHPSHKKTLLGPFIKSADWCCYP
jgi:hypothetical protein